MHTNEYKKSISIFLHGVKNVYNVVNNLFLQNIFTKVFKKIEMSVIMHTRNQFPPKTLQNL